MLNMADNVINSFQKRKRTYKLYIIIIVEISVFILSLIVHVFGCFYLYICCCFAYISQCSFLYQKVLSSKKNLIKYLSKPKGFKVPIHLLKCDKGKKESFYSLMGIKAKEQSEMVAMNNAKVFISNMTCFILILFVIW